tara:strand:+ start:326 stop:562 length:237 start_codon:yes stop_codon:yes gene_type:complete
MTWDYYNIKKENEDDDEEYYRLKRDIKEIIEDIEQLYEKRDDIRSILNSKSLDDMLPADEIKEAVEGLRSVFIGLRLN